MKTKQVKRVLLVGLGMGLVVLLRADEGCLLCHEDASLTMERDGEEISLMVTAAGFEGSAHEGFSCGDCHGELDESAFPHADPMPLADLACLECHDGLGESHSFHAALADAEAVLEMGETVRCSNCHDPHETVGAGGDFGFALAEQSIRCGACHQAVSLEFIHSAHAMAIEHEVEGAPGCLECHQSPHMAGLEAAGAEQRKVVEAELCLSCHLENPEIAGKTLLGTPFMLSFKESVHGQALFSGNAEAPGCVDCHGEHEVARRAMGDSLVSRASIVQRCASCHEAQSHDYLESIHARQFARGNLDAPVCTDCHGEHNILDHTDPEAATAPANLAQQVCGDCHGSVKFAERYGMDADRLSTFEESFHGLAVRGGAVEVVNCASCHGYHDVRPSDDPQSLTHVENIASTCGQCHEGANERFAQGRMHVSISTDSEEPVLYWIASIYTWGIVLIIGGMTVHNGLDFFKKVLLKAGSHWRPSPVAARPVPHRLYVRMTLNERLQHGVLALSFIILVLSGFMLRYPDAWWVVLLRELSSHAFEWRGLVHRWAAVVMVLAGLWHAGYLGFTDRGRALLMDLWPRWKDMTDMKGVLRYNLGLQSGKPRFGRFSYMEKMEYWALIWGSMLMTVTGVLLWVENVTIGLFTKLGFDISRTVHFYEAILATLAIVVWHFYFVIFNPDVYPMNLSWLTGRMSEEEMESEHPLELERIKAAEAGAKRDTEDGIP